MPRLDSDEAPAGEATSEAASVPVVVPSPPESTSLSHGDALTPDEAAILTMARRHRVVAIVGDRRAGKTTLLAEFHQAFLKGPFGGYMFAGSETVLAFEKRCLLGRTASGEAKAGTARTRVQDKIRLLHLAVGSVAYPGRHSHLLLTDISGELSKAARRSAADAEELAPIVRTADRVVVVIDGRKIAHPVYRQRARSDAKTLLRALMEAGGLHGNSRVDVVLNKWDVVEKTAATRQFAEDLLAECPQSIRDSVAEVETHRVSARPRRDASTERWFGMAGLLARWVERPIPKRAGGFEQQAPLFRSFLNYGQPHERHI